MPAPDREHRHEPRGRRVRSSRSSGRSPGSGSTGTGRSRSSSTRWTAVASSARSSLAEEKAYEDEGAIRFRMPDEGVTGWDDVVRGRIEVPNEELEDVVIVRADGRPTYNFASPVEDMDDAITHVIRGDDHISNTPKQIQILRALGHEPPGVRAPRQPPRRRTGRSCRSVTAPSRRGRVPRRRLPPRGARQLPGADRLGTRR